MSLLVHLIIENERAMRDDAHRSYINSLRKMRTTYRVTDQKLFDSKLRDLDTDHLTTLNSRDICGGGFTMILLDGTNVNFSGEHHARRYEKEYGFIFVRVPGY